MSHAPGKTADSNGPSEREPLFERIANLAVTSAETLQTSTAPPSQAQASPLGLNNNGRPAPQHSNPSLTPSWRPPIIRVDTLLGPNKDRPTDPRTTTPVTSTTTTATATSWASEMDLLSAGPSSSTASFNTVLHTRSDQGLKRKSPLHSEDDLDLISEGTPLVINKQGKPSLSVLGAALYKKLRNAMTRLTVKKENRKFLKKYLEVDLTPGFLNYEPRLPYARDDPNLLAQWKENARQARRNYLNILIKFDDDSILKLEEEVKAARSEVRKNITDRGELHELMTALTACVSRTEKQEQEQRMKRLKRDIALAAGEEVPQQDFHKGAGRTATPKTRQPQEKKTQAPNRKPMKHVNKSTKNAPTQDLLTTILAAVNKAAQAGNPPPQKKRRK